MDSIAAVLLFIGLFLGLSFLRIPVAFSMGMAGLIAMYTFDLSVGNAPSVAFQSLDSFPFLAIPGFIYAGDLMTNGGISKVIVAFAVTVVGRIKACMGMIAVVACMLFGTVTGSSLATVAAIGSMMIPEMNKAGYDKRYSTALISASGFLGVLIPPSIPGIIYAITAGIPVPVVWLSTIAAGLLVGAGFIAVNYFVMKDKEVLHDYVPGNYFKNLAQSGKSALPALLMPLLIFGGIYGGVFTPTEAAAVSVAYGILIAVFVYKGLTAKNFWGITRESAINSAVIAVLISFSAIAGRMITLMNVADNLSLVLQAYIHSEYVFLLAVNILLLMVGMLMEPNTAILIAGPILIPLAKSFGIDPVHFGAIVLLNLCIGFITPPFAANLFVGCRIGGVGIGDVLKPLIPFFIVGIVVLMMITYVPAISLYIPNLFM